MRTLCLKLLRELRRHWVQITSIALVMGCGTMTIMGLRGTLASIREARDDYYDAYRFTDLFAHVERAPSTVAPRLAAIPGIAALDTRIVHDVRLDVSSLPEPAIGHMVSVPNVRRPMLNDLQLRRGRWLTSGATDEILISERFAEVNHLRPGDRIAAVINGRWQRLSIVGIAISPEFVVEHASSAVFVDSRRYAIVWASTRLMEGVFDMKAAFNDVVIRLGAGASAPSVEASVDTLLKPVRSGPLARVESQGCGVRASRRRDAGARAHDAVPVDAGPRRAVPRDGRFGVGEDEPWAGHARTVAQRSVVVSARRFRPDGASRAVGGRADESEALRQRPAVLTRRVPAQGFPRQRSVVSPTFREAGKHDRPVERCQP
jgi:hypothetical protein